MPGRGRQAGVQPQAKRSPDPGAGGAVRPQETLFKITKVNPGRYVEPGPTVVGNADGVQSDDPSQDSRTLEYLSIKHHKIPID